jgi:suppressor of fused protein SUFU
MGSAFEQVEDVVKAACPRGASLFKWGVRQTWADGGEDPLEKVWAYGSDEETPHWHYVVSGMADPGKATAKAGASGVGYELTFRLVRQAGEDEAPTWPVTALQEMGWGIFKANMRLAPGHYIRRRRVITGGNPQTKLQGYYLIEDRRLSRLECDSGSIYFLQLVGITDEELLQCEAGEPDEMEAELLARSPLGITDLSRTAPRTESVDLEKLQALQNALGRHCFSAVPDGVTRFSVSAGFTDSGFESNVEASVPFELDARADATLRRIFALHAAAGHELAGIRTEFSKNSEAWSFTMEFDYE